MLALFRHLFSPLRTARHSISSWTGTPGVSRKVVFFENFGRYTGGCDIRNVPGSRVATRFAVGKDLLI